MNRFFFLVSWALVLLPDTAFSHAVIHEDGVSIGFFSKPTFREWAVSYSLKRWVSVGARYFDLNHQKNSQVGVATAGLLLWRGNFNDSQMNFYLTGGVGGENSVSSSNLAGFLSPEWDWESRQWMSAIKVEVLPGISNRPNSLLRARLGRTAFQGESDSLNIWVLMQMDYHPLTGVALPVTFHPSQNLVEWLWTPVIRLTYQNVFLELGTSNNGATHLNFEVHY